LKGIYSSLTRLVSLELKGGIVDSWRPGPSVTLPALQTLRMTRLDGNQVHYIYDDIDAPLLNFLSLEACPIENLDRLRRWRLGPTKFPSLRTFLITEDPEDPINLPLRHFMRAFPHLHTAKFKRQRRTQFRQVLELLLKVNAQGPYWPGLRHLASDFPRFDRRNETYELLTRALTHRINIGHPIETLAVSKKVIAAVLLSAPAWTKLVEVVEYETDDDYFYYTDSDEVEDEGDEGSDI
ncbi:hypothetical protein HWV62_37235, partial [Athelia sp. TMB]